MSRVDRTVIERLLADVGHDTSLVDFALESYERRAPTLVAQLMDAIERDDRQAAAACAHDLASLSGQVGALELAEPARVLEWAAERTTEPLATSARLVRDQLPAVLVEIDSIRRTLSAGGSQAGSSR